MPEFSLPLTAEGAVTAPSDPFAFTVPSAESEIFLDVGRLNLLEIPEFGWAGADGVNPLRIFRKGAVYDAGGLAPSSAPTLAVTGATRSTVVGTWTGQPGNTNGVNLGLPSNIFYFEFRTTLAAQAVHQVKIGASADETFQNMQALIEGTGTHGVEYWNALTYLSKEDDINDVYGLEVSAIDTGANTITMRWIEYGIEGDSAVSTDTAVNFSWASATFTGGADGTGTDPSNGTFRYFYTWHREADGMETGRSPTATITKGGNWNVDITVTASADTTADYVNIYRTTVDGIEFYLVKSYPRGSVGSAYTDSMSDEALVLNNAGIAWNDLLHRTYAEGPPPRGRYLAWFKNRVWSIGAHLHAEHTRGEVAVTNGSATISFVKAGTATALQGVSEKMVGRTFIVDGTAERYTVLSINETAATGVIDRGYQGSTDAHVGFRIIDEYDASRLRACVADLYNQWPVDESPGRIDTDDPEGGTALVGTKERLFAFSRTSIMVVTGDGPESWEVARSNKGVGAVPGMAVGVSSGAIVLDESGFWSVGPDLSLTHISMPNTRPGRRARGIKGTIERISWDHIDNGYMRYDKTDHVVVSGLPLDGATTVTHEVILNLQNGTWSLYRRASWTEVAKVTLRDGSQALLAGDAHGFLWHANVGESDGFYGTEAVQTITGTPTVRSITVTGTPYSTTGDGEKGKPFVVLYADGSTVAHGKVASNTSDTIVPAEDLTAAPAADDQIILGSTGAQIKTGFDTLDDEYDRKNLRSVTVRHAPSTRGEMHFSYAVDNGALQLVPTAHGTSDITLSTSTGKARMKTLWPGDTHQLNMRIFKPGGRAVIRGVVPDIWTREKSTL